VTTDDDLHGKQADAARPGSPVEPPKPTGKAAKPVSVTGCLVPWLNNGQPQLASMPGSTAFYIMCFSSEEKLRSFMKSTGIPFDRIKQIQNGTDFIASIRESATTTDVLIIRDPWITPQGRVRFVQLLEED